MRIGYDAKRAFLNQTGLGNYSRWLIRSMATRYKQNTCFLYTPKLKQNNRINFPGELQNAITITPQSKFLTSWWRSSGIVNDLLRDEIELYHGLSHELPKGIAKKGIRSVVTVHDLIFMRFPQYFGAVSRWIYGVKLKHACRVADKIIAISERTRKDLIELLGVPAEKITVVYQDCDPVFRRVCTNDQKQAVLQKYNLPDEFILSVGTVEERKNLLLVINAISLLNSTIKLVVVGRHTAYAQKIKQCIEQFKLTERVIFLNSVNFSDLPALYQSAKIFVYPSRYEGFGIPVLEALCSGTPVIAAKGSCLEEAGGPDSLYTDPDNTEEMAGKLNRVLGDDVLRQKMVDKGKEYSINFTSDKLAAQIMAVYQNELQHA